MIGARPRRCLPRVRAEAASNPNRADASGGQRPTRGFGLGQAAAQVFAPPGTMLTPSDRNVLQRLATALGLAAGTTQELFNNEQEYLLGRD